ncbi:unnamed protein product [Soboliphyme baturini]|uniref:SP-RING-type domain-containing protein n=1 Tax=Soboliphyme baturini TaxID=241478 RepID=A0A183INN1_9BILA|nr:unnamed protein product [Soboliphyme baturini]
MLPPRLEVQLRICQYDELREQLDDFPMNMVIRLNDNLVTLPQAVSVRKDETPKRPGRPIDVTRLCRAHCNNQRLYVQWEVEAGKLSRRRLEYPCRSSVCKHLQCFDAKVFLEMNEKRASWICPVCYHPALYKDLIIDEYFINVIKQLPPGCSEIEINDDGSWVPVIKKETKKDGEAEPSDTPVMNCLVAPNEPDSPDSEVSTDCCIPRESNERTNRAKFLGLVDLTQESDDEDDDDGSKQGGASVGSHSTKSSTTSSSVIVLDSPQAAIATTPEDPITFKSVEDVLIMSGFGDCLPPPVKKRVVASMYRRDGSNDYRHQTTSSHQHRCSTAATSNARPAETLMDALGGGRRIPHGSAGADNCFPYFTSMFNCPVPSESMCPQSYGQGNGRINESVPAEYTGSANTYISPSYEPYMSSIYRSSMVPNGSHSDVTGKQVDGSIVDSYSRRTRPVAAHHVMYDRMNGHTDSALRSSLINDPSRSYTYSGPPPSTHPFTACMTATYQAQAQTQYVRSYISKRNQ